ncbi:hypothetical protein BS50DRAFT_38090 [Corynespora cassiicola Philippines]|uniref:Uncharacterized protein n=1 Tax=Corynespora cassiicola Philippines TaxID=1448308 RepID=A0A2T2PCH5_CORCC|nr:hypothetical protein BS50DRAFT_38090 [Corynespora cassiicola Philippines]
MLADVSLSCHALPYDYHNYWYKSLAFHQHNNLCTSLKRSGLICSHHQLSLYPRISCGWLAMVRRPRPQTQPETTKPPDPSPSFLTLYHTLQTTSPCNTRYEPQDGAFSDGTTMVVSRARHRVDPRNEPTASFRCPRPWNGVTLHPTRCSRPGRSLGC